MMGMCVRLITNAREMSRQQRILRKPLHRHIQSLRELRKGLGCSRTAPTFEIGQIALTDARFELQMQLRLVAPLANGFQPTVTSKNCSANLRGQHDAADSQFGLPSVINGNVVSILGL